ncbi:MAG: SRPBCC domain-containing protein [Hyphomicrobiales bacterium]
MSTHIHQEVFLRADPIDVYRAFMDEKTHSAFTGGTSHIDPNEGGLVTMHDGQIVARNIELEPGRKIVQAWRVAPWDDGVYTMLRMKFEVENDGTRVTLDQTGCPEEMVDHLAEGWEARYWTPLRTYFESNG